MRLGAAEREQRQRLVAAVGEPAAHAGPDAGQLAAAQLVRLALQLERQRALEHEVDLLLALVAVDPPALARPQADQVQAERRDAELAPQRLEALVAVEVECGERHALLGRRRRGRLLALAVVVAAHGGQHLVDIGLGSLGHT